MKRLFCEIFSRIESSHDLSYYLFDRLKNMEKYRAVAPLKIGLKITNRCNFKCSYCFVKKNSSDLSLHNLKKIFKKIPQLPLEVYLTGGEPTLNPEFIAIVNYLNEMGILVRLHTTGVLLKEIGNYIENNLGVFESIQISLDSIKNYGKIRPNAIEHNCIEKIADFINCCKLKNYENISINTVLSKLNYLELRDIFDFAIYHKVDKVRLSPIFSKHFEIRLNDLDTLEYFHDILCDKKYASISILSDPFCHPWSLAKILRINDFQAPLYCPAQKTEMEIDVNGDVYPCPFLHDPKHLMGNLLKDSFEKVWNTGVDELNKVEWSKNELCIKCQMYPFCGGGCYAQAIVEGKDFDTRCTLHKS